jgi:hypothetical protein
VNRIEKNYNDNRQKLFKQLVKKNITERENYITSLNRYLKQQEEISEAKKAQAFKKYQGYVSLIKIIFIILTIVFYHESNKRKARRKINCNER